MKRLIWILVAVFVTATASAQSLADVAKKEKQRRKEIGSSGVPTVTDRELRQVGGPRVESTVTTSTDTDSDDADSDDDGAADEPEAVDERRDEAYWRGRIDPINTRIATMETRLQGPEFTSNPVGGPDRQRLEAQIATAKAERQAIVDEARRKGVPPGWLRAQ